jgi:hypothetical protein
MSRSTKPKLLTFPPRGMHQGRLRRQPWMRRILMAAVMVSGAAAKPVNSFDVSFVAPAT